MAEITEGIYSIPDDCTVLYQERKVIVKKKRTENKPKYFHCCDCVHQKIGKKSLRKQWYDSEYCEMKPKVVNGQQGYFYCAPNNRIACYMFKNKKEDENNNQ